MPKDPKPDPTKDKEFQKVVTHFLKTPPKPRTQTEKKKPPKGDGK